MKVKGMPIDQYRMSIEARPLRVLYSKYSSTESNNQFVRPLGSVRKERRLSSEKKKERLPKLSAKSSETRPSRRYCVSEIKMSKDSDADHQVCSTRSVNLAADAERSKESPLPSVGRSRAQAFEHRFKIAAARANGQESPVLKQAKDYNKKVIHLPLFRINLKTYKGDFEVNKAVANTRENLRQLMDIHKTNIKPANVVTANIKNYEFHAPPNIANARNNDNTCSNGLIVPPSFPSKPMLKSPRKTDSDKKQEVISKKQCRFCALESETFVRFADDIESKSSSSDRDAMNTDFRLTPFKNNEDTFTDDETDDPLLSLAIRPDTALTLGSTINEIDRVMQSPGSDELRELSEVLKHTDTQPAWPSYDDIMKMRSRNQSRRTKNNSRVSLSRPGTVQNGGIVSPQKIYSVCSNHSHMTADFQKPVLRYTSKQSNPKLKPIIVPSHTCTECPMCNIYKRESKDTPCPPNSPIPSQEPPSFLFEQTVKPRSGASERTRQRKQEVMHLSRINVNGAVPDVSDDRLNLKYMNAT